MSEDEKKARQRAIRRAIEKRYRDSHPEYRKKKIERSTRWKAANRERVNAQANAKYAAKHPAKPATTPQQKAEKQAARARAWRIANPDKAQLADKKFRDSHKEKHSARVKKWRIENPEKVRIVRVRGHAKRRSQGRSAGSFTLAEWNQLLEDTGHKCLSCGIAEAEAIYRYPKAGQPLVGRLTRDHIIPLSQGGAGTINNIAPLCLPCNIRKHDRHIDYRQPGTRTRNRPSTGG